MIMRNETPEEHEARLKAQRSSQLTSFIKKLIVFFKKNGGIVQNVNIDVASIYLLAQPQVIDYEITGVVTVKVLDNRVLNAMQNDMVLDLVSTSGQFNDEVQEAEFSFSSKIRSFDLS